MAAALPRQGGVSLQAVGRHLPKLLSGVHLQSDSGLPDTNGLALTGRGGNADSVGGINCVHGFLIGGAPLYVDRILWLATCTSSSLSSFLVQLFRVVLMKLNYESENSKLKSYESKDRESESFKSESHDSQGTSIHFFLLFPPHNAFKVEKALLYPTWRSRFCSHGLGGTRLAQAFLWELTEGFLTFVCGSVF